MEYLVEENRVLKEQFGSKRVRLTNDQRRRLAAKGKALGRRLLGVGCDDGGYLPIMCWHRRPIAAKWSYSNKRVGRPGIMKAIRALIVRMATDNSSSGYCRVQGELKKVGHGVAPSTLAKTLTEHGIPPSPQRHTIWRTFLRTHADVIAATGSFSVELWTASGLVTRYVLFAVDHATRAVHVAGIRTRPDEAFMSQVARNLTDCLDGLLRGKRYLIVDGDTKFTAQFRRILQDVGVRVVQISYQAPNMNAMEERWVGSAKRECLSKLILFGERSLRRTLREYGAHFHGERPHQSLGNEVIEVGGDDGAGHVVVRERLGGLLKHYHRAAA